MSFVTDVNWLSSGKWVQFYCGKHDQLVYKKYIIVGITTTDVAQRKAIYK